MISFPGNKTLYETFHVEGDPSDTSMVVDGSATPIRFVVPFEVGDGALTIVNIVIAFQGGRLDDPENFSGLATPLLNGLELGGYFRDGRPEGPFGPVIKNNRDLNVFTPSSHIFNYDTATKDVFTATFVDDFHLSFSTKIYAGFYLKIQDDLTGLDWMEAFLRANYS